MSHLPRVIALAHQEVDLIVGLLLRKAFLVEEVDDVLCDAHGVFLMEGERVILSDWVINDLSSLVHECRTLQ